MSSYEPYPASGGIAAPRERVDSHAVFGQVMGLVAVTVVFAAAGAYIGRDLSTGAGWIAFIAAIGCIFGLNVAARRHEQLAIALLFVVVCGWVRVREDISTFFQQQMEQSSAKG